MQFLNVGALVNGQRPKTKKALREAVHDDPASVIFDTTEAFGPMADKRLTVTDALKLKRVLSIVGPDPYAKRSWYGTTTVKDGKLVIL